MSDAAARDVLTDELRIRDTIARAGVVSTLRDAGGFRRLWAADGIWEIGEPYPQRADGVDDVVGMFERLWQGNDYFMQITTQGPIDVQGDVARSTSLCQEFARGPERFYRTKGVWTDDLRREGDRWVFARRAYRYLWLDLSPFSGDVFPLGSE